MKQSATASPNTSATTTNHSSSDSTSATAFQSERSNTNDDGSGVAEGATNVHNTEYRKTTGDADDAVQKEKQSPVSSLTWMARQMLDPSLIAKFRQLHGPSSGQQELVSIPWRMVHLSSSSNNSDATEDRKLPAACPKESPSNTGNATGGPKVERSYGGENSTCNLPFANPSSNESSLVPYPTRSYLEIRADQNDRFCQEQLRQGREASQARDYATAEQHLDRGLELDPHHEELRLARAMARAHQGRFTKALRDVERVLDRQPHHGRAHTCRQQIQEAAQQKRKHQMRPEMVSLEQKANRTLGFRDRSRAALQDVMAEQALLLGEEGTLSKTNVKASTGDLLGTQANTAGSTTVASRPAETYHDDDDDEEETSFSSLDEEYERTREHRRRRRRQRKERRRRERERRERRRRRRRREDESDEERRRRRKRRRRRRERYEEASSEAESNEESGSEPEETEAMRRRRRQSERDRRRRSSRRRYDSDQESDNRKRSRDTNDGDADDSGSANLSDGTADSLELIRRPKRARQS